MVGWLQMLNIINFETIGIRLLGVAHQQLVGGFLSDMRRVALE